MFTKEKLNSSYFTSFASSILAQDPYRVGRFANIHTLSVLVEQMCVAQFEDVKYLSKHNLHLIRTNDLGVGYSSYLSPARLYELMELNKVSKDIPIEFRYEYCNVFTYINIEDIDTNLLLTNEVYFIVHKPTSEIWLGVIGRPTLPNFLFYKSDLDGFKSTLNNIRTLPNINRINISELIDL